MRRSAATSALGRSAAVRERRSLRGAAQRSSGDDHVGLSFQNQRSPREPASTSSLLQHEASLSPRACAASKKLLVVFFVVYPPRRTMPGSSSKSPAPSSDKTSASGSEVSAPSEPESYSKAEIDARLAQILAATGFGLQGGAEVGAVCGPRRAFAPICVARFALQPPRPWGVRLCACRSVRSSPHVLFSRSVRGRNDLRLTMHGRRVRALLFFRGAQFDTHTHPSSVLSLV